MHDTATKDRKDLDDKALEQELEAERGEDAPEDDGTGVPGGALPQDDVQRRNEEAGDHGGEEPPTPPAVLPGEDEEPEEGPELFITADRQLGMKVGGRKPDSSVLKYKGAKVEIEGQFDLETRLTTVDIWQVTGDNNQHTIEKATGTVKASSKAQSATLCATRRIEEFLADKIADDELLYRICEALECGLPERLRDQTGDGE